MMFGHVMYLCDVASVSQLSFPLSSLFYMRRAKVPNLRSFQNGLISLSRASTRWRYSPILGITYNYPIKFYFPPTHFFREKLLLYKGFILSNEYLAFGY